MLVYQRVCYMFFVRKCWLSVVGFPFEQPEATARTTPHLCDQTNTCNREFTNKMQMSSWMQSQATSTIINHHQPTCFFVLLSISINQCPHRFNGFWVSSVFCKAGLFFPERWTHRISTRWSWNPSLSEVEKAPDHQTVCANGRNFGGQPQNFTFLGESDDHFFGIWGFSPRFSPCSVKPICRESWGHFFPLQSTMII